MPLQSIFTKPTSQPVRRHKALDLWTGELALLRNPPEVRISLGDQAESESMTCLDGPVVIGRSPTADLHVRDQWVSRRQCSIQKAGDKYSIRDLESTHGTFVNEKQVSHAKLRDGDIIRIGLTLLTVRYQD
jgi:pSer/pThr/pTyr-binding forkhead associated (FHA) protein